MLRYIATAALAASVVLADNSIPSCGPNNKCPSDTPCCSQYGQCGVGAYCLGGCDPLFSHSLSSCVPNPSCKSGDFQLKSLDDVMAIDKYLGDSSSVNWVSSGKPLVYQDSLLLTMAEGTVGTLLASTHYVWYGKICAKMTTSQGQGVVTAFIMMSDVKDEIDFEFVGVDTQHAQSNYYSQGVTVYTNEQNITAQDTEKNVHEYCIDWKPDSLTWSVDGSDLRTVKQSDTWNKTSGHFDYPQTPARIELSLWPAGLSSNAQGTIEWSGGVIDWNSPYMQNGYYYAMVQEVSVTCYDPPSGANVQGKNAYIYTDDAGTNNTVELQDNTQILKSFYSTGEKPDFDPNAAASSSAKGQPSKTGSAAAQSTTVQPETIPGMSGVGNQGENANSASQAGSEPTGAGGGGAQGTAAGTASTPQNSGGFSQGGGNTNNGNVQDLGRVVGGSIFAVWVAVLGLMVL